jgi:hypothetical protein
VSTQFKDVGVGTKFVYQGETYTRIPDDRQSCCLVYNAQKDSDGSRIMVVPLSEVQVVNQ